jgi:hypothetical protein
MAEFARPRAIAARYYNEEAAAAGEIELAGDATGPSSSNTVVALQNYPIPAGDIGDGQILVSDSSSQWVLQALPSSTAPTFLETKQQIFVAPTISSGTVDFVFGYFQMNDIIIGSRTQRTVKLVLNLVFNIGFVTLADVALTWPAGTFPFQIPATALSEAFDGHGWCENGVVGQAQPMFGAMAFQMTVGGLFVSLGSVPAVPKNPVPPTETQVQYRVVLHYTWLI